MNVSIYAGGYPPGSTFVNLPLFGGFAAATVCESIMEGESLFTPTTSRGPASEGWIAEEPYVKAVLGATA